MGEVSVRTGDGHTCAEVWWTVGAPMWMLGAPMWMLGAPMWMLGATMWHTCGQHAPMWLHMCHPPL
eukprot:2271974-Pyramimonas_sp.AAC.1